MTNARQVVAPPTFTSLPFGLLNAVTDLRSPTDTHWQAGVTWEPICGVGNTTYEKCFTVSGSGVAPVAKPASKAPTAGEGLIKRGATPFTVFSEVDCSAPGFWDRAEETAEQLLNQSEQWQVERAFATGIAAGAQVVFPHLAATATVFDESGIQLQTAATQVTGAVLDVVEGMGRLQEAIANCYDGVPVIHVPIALGSALAYANLLIREGPRYRTPSGAIVVLGAGYPGTAPDGTVTAGARWVYATGAMFIYRGRPTVLRDRDSLDRAKNTLKAIAERTYVIGWDCCHFAVPISTGGIPAGTPNA